MRRTIRHALLTAFLGLATASGKGGVDFDKSTWASARRIALEISPLHSRVGEAERASAPPAAALHGAGRLPLFSCSTPQGRLIVHDAGGDRVTVAFPKPPMRALALLASRPHASRYAREAYSGGGAEQLQVETKAGRLTVYTRTVRTNFVPGQPNDPEFSSGAVFQARNDRLTRRTCRDEASFQKDISLSRPSARPVALED